LVEIEGEERRFAARRELVRCNVVTSERLLKSVDLTVAASGDRCLQDMKLIAAQGT
jgi:hypothetical protein